MSRILRTIVMGVFLGGCATGTPAPTAAERQALVDRDIACIDQAVADLPAPAAASEVEPTARLALNQCVETRNAVFASFATPMNQLMYGDAGLMAYRVSYEQTRLQGAMGLATARLQAGRAPTPEEIEAITEQMNASQP